MTCVPSTRSRGPKPSESAARSCPWALKGKARQLLDCYEEVSRLRAALAAGPDEELTMMLSAASRSLAMAGSRLADTLADLNRTA